jgi:hypothetical protein
MAKKRKVRAYKSWSPDEIKTLRRHSKEKTPVSKVSKEMKRTEPTIRTKAHSIGLSMGHQTRKAKKTRL